MWRTALVLVLLRLQGCLAVAPVVDVQPTEAVRLAGQNVSFLCRVGIPLQYCRIEIPGRKPYNLNAELPRGGEVNYYGTGLENGQCGATIERVRDDFNGPLKCYLGFVRVAEESTGVMNLMVAHAPRAPELVLSTGVDSVMVYRMNDVLHATCTVREGRPVANITWYLDDQQIYGDELSRPTTETLQKEDLHTAMQNLTRILRSSDNGRQLRCVADHPAYKSGHSVASIQLDVKYPPLPQGNPIDLFDYALGQAGKIVVVIEANPKPQIEWVVRDQHMKVGSEDSTGRMRALPMIDRGKGRYEAVLEIAEITKADTEAHYTLRAYNDMGTQEYYVQISTNPEPEGLEMGAGAIIGIVVAILILLLLVFVVIFARITGRWCFSGARQKRNIAESSDTESADVRPKEERRILTPIKLTSFFKKNKSLDESELKHHDQTGTEDEIKVPLDDSQKQPQQQQQVASSTPVAKEGIVYAELDLVSQNLKPVVKNDDEKTEYAEIVYTKEGEQDGGEKKGGA